MRFWQDTYPNQYTISIDLLPFQLLRWKVLQNHAVCDWHETPNRSRISWVVVDIESGSGEVVHVSFDETLKGVMATIASEN